MAALASTAVTQTNAWTEGGTNGRRRKCLALTLVLTGQGTVANPIDAVTLGLTTIEEVTPAVKSDDTKVYPAAPSYTGTKVLLIDLTNITDANRAAPADITATVKLTVKGY